MLAEAILTESKRIVSQKNREFADTIYAHNKDRFGHDSAAEFANEKENFLQSRFQYDYRQLATKIVFDIVRGYTQNNEKELLDSIRK